MVIVLQMQMAVMEIFPTYKLSVSLHFTIQTE